MLLVVTGIGTLIAIYASGYMDGDTGYTRFFAYVGLFISSTAASSNNKPTPHTATLIKTARSPAINALLSAPHPEIAMPAARTRAEARGS